MTLIPDSRRRWVAQDCWACKNEDPAKSACPICDHTGRVLGPQVEPDTHVQHIRVSAFGIHARVIPGKRKRK